MRNRFLVALNLLFSLFALVNAVRAADDSLADQFLGSPLLILVVVLVIDVVAFVFHKIRK